MSSDTEGRQSFQWLDNDSRYVVRVRSLDALGNRSDWSEALELDTSGVDNGSQPVAPSIVGWTWSGRDLVITWRPTLFNLDGSAADISHYEFRRAKSIDTSSGAIEYSSIRLAEGTSFTYTYEKNVDDSSATPHVAATVMTAFIVAVAKSGSKSQPNVFDPIQAIHTVPKKPPAPYLSSSQTNVTVHMTKGDDAAFDHFELLYSDNGGITFRSANSSITTSSYVFNVIPATYMFKYRVYDIYGSYGGYSDIASTQASYKFTGIKYNQLLVTTSTMTSGSMNPIVTVPAISGMCFAQFAIDTVGGTSAVFSFPGGVLPLVINLSGGKGSGSLSSFTPGAVTGSSSFPCSVTVTGASSGLVSLGVIYPIE